MYMSFHDYSIPLQTSSMREKGQRKGRKTEGEKRGKRERKRRKREGKKTSWTTMWRINTHMLVSYDLS